MKKFELTDRTVGICGHKLSRIRALTDFGGVKAGDLGGYVESESNLSHDGSAWIYGNAKVFGNAKVCNTAEVYDSAWIYGNAKVSGNARVSDNAVVYGNAVVRDSAEVFNGAKVYGNAVVRDSAGICGSAEICSNDDYLCVKGLGSYNRHMTFYRSTNGVSVKCGCFNGTLDDFAAKVVDTHGNNKYAKEYLAMVQVAKIHFGLEED